MRGGGEISERKLLLFKKRYCIMITVAKHAGVMELADVTDSKSVGATRAGSSPATGTISSVHNGLEL